VFKDFAGGVQHVDPVGKMRSGFHLIPRAPPMAGVLFVFVVVIGIVLSQLLRLSGAYQQRIYAHRDQLA
jgi:hypothetical protein